MKKSFFRGGVVGMLAAGLMLVGFIGLADAQKGPCSSNKKCSGDPNQVATIGDMSLKGTAPASLKGRVYAHWADNPAGRNSLWHSILEHQQPRRKPVIPLVGLPMTGMCPFLIRSSRVVRGGIKAAKIATIPMPDGTTRKQRYGYG